jgi:phosphohistidine phosphatase
MAIYLAQHGKAASKDVDPQRGLTPDGVAETDRVASLLARSNLTLDVIWHSGKTRTRQTAEILDQPAQWFGFFCSSRRGTNCRGAGQ